MLVALWLCEQMEVEDGRFRKAVSVPVGVKPDMNSSPEFSKLLTVLEGFDCDNDSQLALNTLVWSVSAASSLIFGLE